MGGARAGAWTVASTATWRSLVCSARFGTAARLFAACARSRSGSGGRRYASAGGGTSHGRTARRSARWGTPKAGFRTGRRIWIPAESRSSARFCPIPAIIQDTRRLWRVDIRLKWAIAAPPSPFPHPFAPLRLCAFALNSARERDMSARLD